jgi:hypothetical protein
MRGSRQFGQSVVWGTRKASCARRLAVRAFECRRFGFGIITPFEKWRHKEAQKAQKFFLLVLRRLCFFVVTLNF